MSLNQTFNEIKAGDIVSLAQEKKEQGSRFVQLLATNTIDGVDVTYSFLTNDVLENFKVVGIQKDDEIESITPWFFSAFVFENEAHDLFGVKINNIALDFGGRFYDLAISEPMTILSPAQKAAKDAAIEAQKAAKEEKGGE